MSRNAVRAVTERLPVSPKVLLALVLGSVSTAVFVIGIVAVAT